MSRFKMKKKPSINEIQPIRIVMPPNALSGNSKIFKKPNATKKNI